MSTIEQAIRERYPEGGPEVELAAKLAFIMDAGDGSAAIAKELRLVLAELRQRLPVSRVIFAEGDDEGEKLGDLTPPKGALWIINGEKVSS
jgi:hypothetical protein